MYARAADMNMFRILGDMEAEIAPGTTFEKLPDDWTCPDCQEEKHNFIQADFPADRK